MHDPMVFILEESLEAIEKGVLTRTQCLERYPEHRNELAALLDAALILRSAKIPAPNPVYFKAGKARLIAQIKQEQQVTIFDRWNNFIRAISPTSLKRQAVSLVLLVTLLFVILGGGTVYASAHALPGDVLYPVKTAVENLQLVLAGEERDSELNIQFTAVRVEEIETLLEAGREQDIDAAVQRFEENLLGASQPLENPKPGDEGWAEQKATHLGEQMDRHIGVLNRVFDKAPDSAKPTLARVIAVTEMKKVRLEQQWRGVDPSGPPDGVEPAGITEEPALMATERPLGTGKPTDLPSGRPTDAGQPAGTGKPTDLPSGRPTDAGKPEDTPGGRPTDAGKPEDTPGGRPTDAGKPENPGKPTDTPGGKPENPGKPTDTPGGQPENPGKPTDTPGEKPENPEEPEDPPVEEPGDTEGENESFAP